MGENVKKIAMAFGENQDIGVAILNPQDRSAVSIVLDAHNNPGGRFTEFVETNSVRDRLAALGIQFGQGYALGRPGPLGDVIAAVADRASEGRERPFTEPKAYTTPSGIPIMFKHA